MGYKMKKFSGFGTSPAKQSQGFGGKGLIKAQKELAGEEMSYKAPGWARMATSILPGYDPTGQAKGRKKTKASEGKEAKEEKGGGGVMGGIKEAQGAYDKFNEIKDFDWQGAFTNK